ncbi:MAG: valine--tRNA ligase [Gammaproteobacteria bacterium]|nr:valine--tRNA ligase [Gammaproteobacteria bacterium]MDE0368039.1 valine--tRNA ligase [Gammaproteobacteria bacterium]
MERSFDPHAIERELYEEWEAAGYFAPSGEGSEYCIAIPPPNVTGSLHMGHAFQHTLMDALIRYHRMNGRRTLWQMGTDHAGISTQMLVERQLNGEGKTRREVGRDAFIERVWEWKERSGGNISRQLRRMGSSVDWSRDRFTLDDGFAGAVMDVFVRLYEEGLIYRGKRLVNWDPQLATAISDLEIENREEDGHLWHFRYPLKDGATTVDGKDYLVVATTRPETMLGDTGVAVHPGDERYRHLVGKVATLPLVGRALPIVADEYVDPEFGTGCVKITPAHDFNDNQVGARHGLPLENIFTARAAINENAPEAYRGLDRLEARKRIVADLDALGLLDGVEPHRLTVPRGDRSEAVVEPWLTDQWFVKIAPLAEAAVAAVENGDIEFVPNQYANVYFAWMREIQDWCISRQLWWGHRIPAWYDADGNIHVGRTEAEARLKGNLSGEVVLTRDEDVLDTWFSSALWTFATLGWPAETNELKRFHPTDVLVTGHDIIFFWVTRMIMMTLKFMGEVPFRKVYIHGLVRDAEGRKMSKTKGNGLDPLDLIDGIVLEDLVRKRTENLTQPRMAPRIEKDTRKDFPKGIPSFGTDALRFTFCALASTGRDVRFDLSRTEGYRNFCNKLWNAARFVLMNAREHPLDGPAEPGLAGRWIQSRARRLVEDCHLALETYRFDLYANAIYEFAWHEYCDWYLELAKPLLWDENAPLAHQTGARRTLVTVLELLLRAAHPILPFITETIWRDVAPLLAKAGPSIMLEPFPQSGDLAADPEAEASIDWLKGVVTALRNIRGEAGIKPGREIDVLLQGGDARDRDLAASSGYLLQRLAKVSSIDWLPRGERPPANALALVGELKVMVPLAGVIDIDAERARINKQIERKQKELQRIGGKLGNEKFVRNAPPAIVEKERNKAADVQSALTTLKQQLDSLA